jgi:hypothetical protein
MVRDGRIPRIKRMQEIPFRVLEWFVKFEFLLPI